MVEETVSNENLSSLIGLIYDCSIDPSLWKETLPEVAFAMDCDRIILSLNDLQHDRILINQSHGWDPHWIEVRATHAPEIHARISEWIAHHPRLDVPFVASRKLSASYLATSPYVRDCLQPLGIVDVAHYFLVRSDTIFSEVVLCRNERQGIMTDAQVRIGDVLLPHLRRSITISNFLEVQIIERARLTEALDALRCGVVLTNERGAILHANQPAQTMLLSGRPINASHGVLQANLSSANKELHRAIQLGSRNEAAMGSFGFAVRLTEFNVRPLFAHVLPLSGSDLRLKLQPAAVAAVFIGGETNGDDGASMLAIAFGLTSAETRVAGCLLQGHTLTSAAESLGIAQTTARTHLDSIFQKTGVSRQAELVRLTMQILSPASAIARISNGKPDHSA